MTFNNLDEFDYGCNQTRTTRTELFALELESSLEQFFVWSINLSSPV